MKTNIEKIGGTVDVDSRPGSGTTVKIKIPLTLAIIPALIVTSGGDRYAIPQVSLLELVRLEGEQARRGIERIHGAPVYRLRGNLLPLVYLDRAAAGRTGSRPRRRRRSTSSCCRPTTASSAWSSTRSTTPRRSWSSRCGKQLKGIAVLRRRDHHGRRPGGADPRRARAGADGQRRDRGSRAVPAARKNPRCSTHGSRQSWLLFRSGAENRLALPLSAVARLEEFPAASSSTPATTRWCSIASRSCP